MVKHNTHKNWPIYQRLSAPWRETHFTLGEDHVTRNTDTGDTSDQAYQEQNAKSKQ